MTSTLPLLTDEQLKRQPGEREDAGVGTLATERGNLPLEAIDVDAAITGLLARTTLRQTFVNPFDEPLEATYIFPLPGRGAVTEFRMVLADRTVVGTLKEREAARVTYDRAIAEGKRAAIAEEERPGVFTVRVGNLQAGERATVQLTVTGPLEYADGEATYRFPLVVAPRYIPGTPLPDAPVGDGTAPDTDAVPDASRITPPVLLPGFPNPVRLGITADLDPAGLRAEEPKASLHSILTERRDGGGFTVTAAPGDRANRDFVLRFLVADEDVTTSLAVAPDPAGGREASGEAGEAAPTKAETGGKGEATFALTLVPPVPAADVATRPRDVVLLLDRSGSMAGWKMVAARRAAARMVDTLTSADRFAVIAFDHTLATPPELPADALAPATDRNRYRAVEFLARLDARGGTAILPALTAGLNQLATGGGPVSREVALAGGPDGQRDLLILLVTDGQIGNEDQVLQSLAPELALVRTFTVGIDRAVNAAFLERLASISGGACELVESEDRLDQAMDRIHRRVSHPALVSLSIGDDGLGLDAASVTPERLPDLFEGAPLVITGRCKAGQAGGGIKVVARTAAGTAWETTVAARASDSAALAPVWARGRLRDLEDRYLTARGGESAALADELIKTSLRFGVLCRFTAFVAVDEQVVNEGGQVRRVVQPVDQPADWILAEAERAPLSAGAAPSPMMAPSGPPPDGTVYRAMSIGPKDVERARAIRFAQDPLSGPDEVELDLDAPELPFGERTLGGGGAVPGGPKRLAEERDAAVRERAARLLALLEQAERDRSRRLGALRTGLDDLVEALENAGAREDVLRPLVAALRLVRETAGATDPTPDVVDRAWREGLAAIRGLAEGNGKLGGSDKRRTFWKRPKA